jgi:hypothetical protein
LDLVFPLSQPIDAGQESSNSQENGGHFRENVPGELGEGILPQVLFPAEKAKIDVRKIEYGGSPDLVLPPDLMEITIGLGLKPSSCFGKQFLAIAEDRGFRGADLDTPGFFPLEDSGVAEIAFLNRRSGTFPVISRDPERTGIHAISTAQTDRDVIDYGAFGGSSQGRNRTGGHTGRIEAMLAMLADVTASGAGDYRGPTGGREPVGG